MLHLYVGPSLAQDDLRDLPDSVTVHRPIQHGDLLTGEFTSGDTVVILDGLYHQTNALRHKEIIHVLRQGVRIIGAASIGALRAAELAPVGMIGVGRVYEAYATGRIVGDDEVAVAHAPQGNWAAQNLPLVNIRFMLDRAAEEGIVDQAASIELLKIARSIYYPQRSSRAVIHHTRQAGHGEFADWLTGHLSTDHNFCNQKRLDGLEAIRLALQPHPMSTPLPVAEHSGERNWRTVHFREWHNHFHTTTVDGQTFRSQDRLWFQQFFNPQFPQVWEEFLEFYSANPGDDSPGQSLAERMRELYGASILARSDWRETACTVFRPRVDVSNPLYHPVLFKEETQENQETLKRYLARNDEFRARNPRWSYGWLREDVAARLLAELWQIPADDLERQAHLRGFHSRGAACRAFSRFLLGYVDSVRQAAA